MVTTALILHYLRVCRKKPTFTHPGLGDVYAGEDTRPLSLVNADNRIIASAARIRWEHTLGTKYISRMQQGFLKGRSMIGNILEIDYDSMSVSLKHDKGVLLLFDFKAAFPSVSHDFLMTSLKLLGLPPMQYHSSQLYTPRTLAKLLCKVKHTKDSAWGVE